MYEEKIRHNNQFCYSEDIENCIMDADTHPAKASEGKNVRGYAVSGTTLSQPILFDKKPSDDSGILFRI